MADPDRAGASAMEIAAAVHSGRMSAAVAIRAALDRIERGDARIGAVTHLLSDRALAAADRVDGARAAGHDPGPFAGVPFVAKDLFDVEGLTNTAGAEVRSALPVAGADAALIADMEAAGAILVGTANMDAFAYGFSTQNAWTGVTRNPHDAARLAGGSSGGSAAAVAAGMVPLALGSDTNGSVRVPASLCGLYGLKPTHGRLPTGGTFPFAGSFDDAGPFTTTIADLVAFWTVATGEAVAAPDRPLRLARLGGWFADGLDHEVATAIDDLCRAIGMVADHVWAGAAAARSGAFLMTAAEGGALHHDALARDAARYDPGIRDRLLAGTYLSARDYIDAQSLMHRMRGNLDAVFAGSDIIVTPATPATAPAIDHAVVTIGGQAHPARSHLGVFTQPITFLGLPALSAPLLRPGLLPLGVQLVARPGREADLFAVAAQLERAGLVGASPPPPDGAEG